MFNQLVLLVFLSFITTSCNSLFYYPDRITYLTPDKKGFKYREATMKTPDGETLNYWVIAPKREKIGTILHFHGNAQNVSAHFLFVAWLTEFGYEVISFDYRGYGHSTGTPDRKGLIVDGQVMLSFLESKQIPYLVIGQSLGGAVAIPAITRLNPKYLRGLILDSTFASYRGIARDKLAQQAITWLFQWPLSFLVTDDLSPVDTLQGIEVPVMQFHSKQDFVVPFKQGKELFNALGKVGQFVVLKRRGHTTAFVPPFEQHHKDLLHWLCTLNSKPDRCLKLVGGHELVKQLESSSH
ncbi:MAG: alpha/beta hydrolase [Oligoflexales bacterium]